LYEQAGDNKKLCGALEIQLKHTTDAAQRLERLQRLAQLSETALKDRGAAYGYWLRAFAENVSDQDIRAQVERLAAQTGGWNEIVEAYEQGLGKLRGKNRLPLYATVARVYEKEL